MRNAPGYDGIRTDELRRGPIEERIGTPASPRGQQRDPQVVTKAMRRVRARDTSPELAYRRALHRRGLRYVLRNDGLLGKPDVVFPGARLAVFIDGDFWHGNQPHRRGHGSLEEQFTGIASRGYWVRKIRRTMERDRVNTAKLAADGWRVLRFWESQVTTQLAECVEMTVAAVRGEPTQSAWPGLPDRTFAEFFAGIGLVRLGLEAHGWRAAFANDIDPKKWEIYAANFPNDSPGHYRLQDIRTLKPDDIPSVTLATASFPCTDLSLAGERNGLAGSESGTVFPFLHLLRDMGPRRPPMVLLENVVGFLTSHGGADFRRVLRELNDLGYGVDAFVLDAIRFVPQSRPRLFVVGVQDGGTPSAPGALIDVLESPVRPRALLQRIHAETGIRWRFQPLPAPPAESVALADILEDLPDDAVQWWSEERAGYLVSQMSDRHVQLAANMIASPRVRYGTVYRRVRYGKSMAELRADGIAGCLRTPRGGSSRQILFEAGNGSYRVRFMTPREYARLQGAPDTYRMPVPPNQALFGFGDAVCVPAVAWIAEHYLNIVTSQLIRGQLLTISLH